MGRCKKRRVKEQASSKLKRFTTAEVAKHNKPTDCYVIIEGKVYNVTAHVDNHSGGAACISQYCGKDATAAFMGKPHSAEALKKLKEFLIGEVVD